MSGRAETPSFPRRREPRGAVVVSGPWGPAEIARLALLGLAVGSLRAINTWDVPVYMLLAAAAVLLAAYFRNGGLSLQVLVESGAKTAVVVAVGFLAFLPYHASTETFFTSVEATTNQTVLWQFLLIHGLFVFIVASHLLLDLRGYWQPLWQRMWGRAGAGRARLVPLGIAVLLAGYLAFSFLTGVTGSTIPFALLLLVLAAASGMKRLASRSPDTRQVAFRDRPGMRGPRRCHRPRHIPRRGRHRPHEQRLQALPTGVGAPRPRLRLPGLAHPPAPALLRGPCPRRGRAPGAGPWALLVLAAAVYPLLGTQDRLRTRFEVLPLTLDGMAYMRTAEYNDPNGTIDLSSDYDAIRWLQANVQGSPVVLEGLTPNYRWGGRISVYTGLPSVVGWRWHQEQQRWGYRWAVGERARDVDRIHATPDAAEALDLMRKYDVEYVYLGRLERLYYPAAGLAKFDADMPQSLEQVYRTDQVSIYRLRPETP